MRRKVRIFKWSAPLWSLVALGATATVVFAWGILFYLGAFHTSITTAESGDVTMTWVGDPLYCAITAGPGTITCTSAADGINVTMNGVDPTSVAQVGRTIRNDGDSTVYLNSFVSNAPTGVLVSNDPPVGQAIAPAATADCWNNVSFNTSLPEDATLPTFNMVWEFDTTP